MAKEIFQHWLADFYAFLEKDNKDLIGLYNGRVLFIPGASNNIKPELLQLSEAYATKEQIKRMSEVFEDYLLNHPL